MTRKAIDLPKDIPTIPVEDLIPYDKNPRNHKQAGIDELCKAIETTGWTVPVVVDQNNRIVAGHGRRLAALQLKMSKVPVVKLHLTEDEYLKAVLSDNKLAEMSSWNKSNLKEIMSIFEEIEGSEFEVAGFSDADIDKIFGHNFKETLETSADFGDAGEVDVMDEATRVTSMTLKMSVKDHKKVKGIMSAIMRENDFETTGEAIVFMASKFSGPSKTVRRNA